MGITGYSHSRNHGLDFLKGIAACGLVLAHMSFPWPYGGFFAYVASCGVSIFFMTSGYFSLGASREKLLHALKRTALYLLVAYFLYLFRMLIVNGLDFRVVGDFLMNQVLTPQHLLKTLIFSQSKICPVAWFLISLLMCYAMKLLLGRWFRYLGYLGFIAAVVVILPPVGSILDFPLFNPWLWGIPFFVLGELVREHEDKLQNTLSRRTLLFLCLVAIVNNLVARYIGTQWWHLGNMLLAPSLFLLLGGCGMRYNIVCRWGSTYAFFIYIVHPLVGFVYNQLRENQGYLECWLRPFAVLLATILLAMVFYYFKSLIGRLLFSRYRERS